MLSFIKKILILILMTCSSCSIIKNITDNFMLISENFLQNSKNKLDCFLLKNKECKVRKVIIDNGYMTFPCKIKFDKCIVSCNDKDNPYYKICLPDIIKNVIIKGFDLLSQKNVLRNIPFHKSCKCGCLLDEKVCNNKQKWNKEKCRCEYLKIKNSNIGYSWNVSNCRCEMKKLTALIKSEECKEITMILLKMIVLCKIKQ